MVDEPIDGRPALLVIEVRPRTPPPVPWWFPIAVRWPALRCLVGRHPWPREMRLRRAADGAIAQPPVVQWTCRRCGRALGETNLSTLGVD